MKQYLDTFAALADARRDEFLANHGLILKTGEAFGAAILKLVKSDWTTDPMDEIVNTNGLFFSIWVDADSAKARRARYNLHAKKLRAIKGEAFAARDFARNFRTHAKFDLTGWPNLSIPKGPITLFEGYVRLDPATLSAESSALMDRFAALTPRIDRLLAAAGVAPDPAQPANP